MTDSKNVTNYEVECSKIEDWMNKKTRFFYLLDKLCCIVFIDQSVSKLLL